MKQKISYSLFNAGVTVTTIILWILIIACGVLYCVFNEKPFADVFFWIFIGALIVSVIWTFYIVPTSVSVDDENINVHKTFKTRKIKFSDIKSVEPTKINRYKEASLPFRWIKTYVGKENGRFYYYYGMPKNPVEITFKDGSHYTIGSSNPTEFIEFVNKKIK